MSRWVNCCTILTHCNSTTLGRNRWSNLPWVQFYGDLDSVREASRFIRLRKLASPILLGPFMWRKSHSPTRATLGKPTFHTFFHKTWRTVNTRKGCWLALKGDPRSWTNFSPFFNTLARPAESTLTSVYARKKLTRFTQANNAYACSDCLKHSHDRGDPAGRAKVFLWRKIDPAWRVIMPWQKRDSGKACHHSSWVNVLFFMLTVRHVCKEMYEKLARPGKLGPSFLHINGGPGQTSSFTCDGPNAN